MPASYPNLKGHNLWIIRAGSQAEIAHNLLDRGVVAIGWPALGDFPLAKDWQLFRAEIKKRLPSDYSEQSVGAAAGQLWTFINEIKVGDYVITPVKSARQVLVGIVKGEYKYDPDFNTDYPRIRKVQWLEPVDWDSVPQPQRNSFFAWQTIHQPREDFSFVIEVAEHPSAPRVEAPGKEGEIITAEPERDEENLAEKAEEAIRLHLQRIPFDEFQPTGNVCQPLLTPEA